VGALAAQREYKRSAHHRAHQRDGTGLGNLNAFAKSSVTELSGSNLREGDLRCRAAYEPTFT
jgi:hypothetical protein